jgi:hypothetical protein
MEPTPVYPPKFTDACCAAQSAGAGLEDPHRKGCPAHCTSSMTRGVINQCRVLTCKLIEADSRFPSPPSPASAVAAPPSTSTAQRFPPPLHPPPPSPSPEIRCSGCRASPGAGGGRPEAGSHFPSPRAPWGASAAAPLSSTAAGARRRLRRRRSSRR